MGTVYRQKGRTIWMLKYYREGRPVVETSGTDNKKKANTLLRSIETDIDRGLPMSSAVGKLRFEEAARDIQTDYVINGHATLAWVKRRIRLHLAPAFGGRRLATITTADVRLFVTQQLEAEYAHAEINRQLSVLKRMFAIAMQGGKLLHRPHIPMLKEDNTRTGFFEPDQFAAVHARLPDFVQPVMQFAYLTGWRVPSEILKLEWRQVDFAGGTVRLDPGRTKNDDGRLFPFDALPAMANLLELQRGRRLDLCPLVFHRAGKAIRDAWRAPWKTACEEAGWPGMLGHDFRRTAVRNLVRAGVPEKTAMLLTGHKTRSVFDRYDIVNEADLREAVSRLAALPTKKTAAGGRVVRMAKASLPARRADARRA